MALPMPKFKRILTADITAYMKDYNAQYRASKGPKSSVVKIGNQFPEEPAIPQCSAFGCGRTLSLIESLAGRVCTRHMNCSKTDPTKWRK